MPSNASLIHTVAVTRLQDLLGAEYREHTDIFSTEDLSAVSLENGFAVILLGAEEKPDEGNALILQREMKVVITHRTYASADSAKVKVKLQTVYDKEAEILASFRCWADKTIGILAAIPGTSSEVEKFADGEDSFIVNTINFSIIYVN